MIWTRVIEIHFLHWVPLQRIYTKQFKTVIVTLEDKSTQTEDRFTNYIFYIILQS